MRTRTAMMLSLVLLGAMLGGAPPAPAAIAPCDWPMYGRDLGHSFATSASCTRLSRLTVSTLRPKWFYKTPTPVTASPSVVDGVVYVGSAEGKFYALRADQTGAAEPTWTYDITDRNRTDYGKIVSSAAITDAGGKRIVVFGGGATLHVLDAADGGVLTTSCYDPRDIGADRCAGSTRPIQIESSPAIVHDDEGITIVVGMDFNESSGVGRAGVVAQRLHTDPWSLETLWKFDPERLVSYTADASKDGESGYEHTPDPLLAGGKGSGCGNVWASPAVDTDAGLVFFAVGNCTAGSMPAGEVGGESIVAVDLATGKLAWRHAPRGINSLDLDFGASPNLLPGGLVGEGGKDGVYYAMARTPGTTTPQPVWKTKLAPQSDIGGMIGTPAIGEVAGQTAIFATTAIPFGTRGLDQTWMQDPRTAFALHAIRASDGAILWHAPLPFPAYGSAVYANGVVLVPDTFGFSVNAWDAETGAPLWWMPLNGPPSSAPAVVGDSIYMGTGTAANGVPVDEASGIWAFQLAIP